MELRSPEGHLQREVRCPRPSPPFLRSPRPRLPRSASLEFSFSLTIFVSPAQAVQSQGPPSPAPRAPPGAGPASCRRRPGSLCSGGRRGGVGGRAAALEAERVPGGLGAARRRPGGERAVGFPSGRAPGRLSQAALFLVDNKGRSKGLAVQVRSPRGSLRSPVIKASAPRVSGRPSPRLPGRRAARPAGDQRSPGLHPKEAGPLPPPPHPHPPPAKPTGENRSRHPPGPRPSHPELPGGAGTRGPERVATCRGRANWLQRAGAGRRARGPPEVGPRLPRATSGLRGRGGAGAVPDLELPAQHRNAERLFITLRPPQPPNTAPPPRVALDSLKRSPASAARWRHLELGAGKAAPSARLVALAAPGDAAAQRGGQRKATKRTPRLAALADAVARKHAFRGSGGVSAPAGGRAGRCRRPRGPRRGHSPPGSRREDPGSERSRSARPVRGDSPGPTAAEMDKPGHQAVPRPQTAPAGRPKHPLAARGWPKHPLASRAPCRQPSPPEMGAGGLPSRPGPGGARRAPPTAATSPPDPSPSPSWRVRIAYGRKRTPRGPTFPPWKPKSKNRITAGGVDQFSLQAVHRPPPAAPFPSSSPGHYPTPHLQTSRGGFFPSFLAPPSAPRTPPPRLYCILILKATPPDAAPRAPKARARASQSPPRR
eukprot:XP_022270399.1 basic proline-rich protein-like [Canis lupus familiaris]